MSAENWQRLADYIGREMAARGWNRTQLAAAAGAGLRTVDRLLTGKPHQRMTKTLWKIESALDWAPGTARRILEGETPEPEPKSDDDDYDAWVDDLMARVERLPRHIRLRTLARINMAILEADERQEREQLGTRSDDQE